MPLIMTPPPAFDKRRQVKVDGPQEWNIELDGCNGEQEEPLSTSSLR